MLPWRTSLTPFEAFTLYVSKPGGSVCERHAADFPPFLKSLLNLQCEQFSASLKSIAVRSVMGRMRLIIFETVAHISAGITLWLPFVSAASSRCNRGYCKVSFSLTVKERNTRPAVKDATLPSVKVEAAISLRHKQQLLMTHHLRDTLWPPQGRLLHKSNLFFP